MKHRENELTGPQNAFYTLLAIVCFAAFFVACIALSGAGFRQWTDKQTELHEAAEVLRAAGYTDDSAAIQALKTEWHAEEALMTWMEIETIEEAEARSDEIEITAYAEETPIWEAAGLTWTEYCSMCYCNYRESGPGCSREHQQSQAAVILNRVWSDRFPDTVYEVLTQPGQYSGNYIRDSLDGIPEENIDAVNSVLAGEFILPADVVWQANFMQGTYVYATYYVNSDGFKSTTYFCGGYPW